MLYGLYKKIQGYGGSEEVIGQLTQDRLVNNLTAKNFMETNSEILELRNCDKETLKK